MLGSLYVDCKDGLISYKEGLISYKEGLLSYRDGLLFYIYATEVAVPFEVEGLHSVGVLGGCLCRNQLLHLPCGGH